ncbi:MAG: beta-galactosidase [Clostridia bacterium]|nr:beta-galactosidase [Clostridia bacterium]
MIDHFLIGCCYYPEHWDENSLTSDLDRIKSLGFNTVRMGEFSWSMYESEEGRYDFSLLERAVEYAGKLGIDVILGTPTAAPPKWLTDKYPEVLCVDANGNTMQHGSRQHNNYTSKIYLKYCAAITEAMAKCFCKYNNVIGWQIDNELNCHRSESYAKTDDEAFREWLEKKYKTIENLNECMGLRFWSMEYNSFSQISCPRPTPAYRNPSFMTDYYLFLSDSAVRYASVQAKILKKYMPDAFVTHNGYFENLDYKKLTDECLDILAFDSYPSFSEQNGKGRSVEAGYRLALTHGCCEKFLVLEQQAGPGGQNSYLVPTPLPGQIRLWTYQSIAHGAVSMLYFRYRTALFGAEQLWYGIYDHDLEENYRSREIRQISEELSRVGDLFIANRQHNDVAFYYDYHNICANKTESFAPDDMWYIHTGLNDLNIHADFIYSYEDMKKYKVVILSHIAIADETLAEKVREFADNGGIVIISSRSGTKDIYDRYYPQKAPGVFSEAAGCSALWFTSLPASEEQNVLYGGKTYSVKEYCEVMQPSAGTVVGTYTDGFCRGKPAIVKNGNIYYIGFYVDSGELYRDIIANHIDVPELPGSNTEEYVLGDYKMYLNYGEAPVDFECFDLLTEKNITQIPPFGVVMLKKD